MRLTHDIALVGGGNTGFNLSAPLDCHIYVLDGGGDEQKTRSFEVVGEQELVMLDREQKRSQSSHSYSLARVPDATLSFGTPTPGAGAPAGGSAQSMPASRQDRALSPSHRVRPWTRTDTPPALRVIGSAPSTTIIVSRPSMARCSRSQVDAGI